MKVKSLKGGLPRFFACAAIFFAAALASPIASPAFAQPAQQAQPAQDAVRTVLTQFGKFVQHQRYGEVWVPTVTPPGWHPYPPCHWVYTKQVGWYFDDKSPWGQIIHHYGRWTNDPQMGWVWVPGAEFSPGWVVWRTDEKWIGWAPTPPDADIQLVSTDAFNNGSQWIFIEVGKMKSGCNDRSIAAAGLMPVIFRTTRLVTAIEYIDGIAVFILPPYIVGPFIDVDIFFDPWPAWFFAQAIFNWNWLWSNTNLVINVVNSCGPGGYPSPVPIGGP